MLEEITHEHTVECLVAKVREYCLLKSTGEDTIRTEPSTDHGNGLGGQFDSVGLQPDLFRYLQSQNAAGGAGKAAAR